MLVLDVIVSGFAAWGLFCAMKFIADGYMTPKASRPRPVVRLSGKESSSEIAELCENARKAIICNRGEIILLVPEDCGYSRRLRDELDSLGLYDVNIAFESKTIIQKEGRAENE